MIQETRDIILSFTVEVTGIGPSEHKMCEYYRYIYWKKWWNCKIKNYVI